MLGDGAFGIWLSEWYLWIKAAHVISVIAWLAGMLYLPRLYVYHCAAEVGSVQSETFKVMERRLLRGIINPAMLCTWLFGILLVLRPGFDYMAGWFHVKLTMVILLQLVHAAYARWRKQFARDENKHSDTVYRVANEIPTVLMIVIVIMVIVKPF
ncbi:MAG TPA: protoporphyrinogen oxidase HemJ [Alphaproteobacteria bacterium]|nr:protoporphyrinogen oxidase HemJ [Alphaproteobacteria bacterium]